MGKYIELNKNNFDTVTGEGVTVVDFWAPWCGPCRVLGPIIEEIAEDFEGKVTVCKVNTDEETELGIKFGIRSIPTVLFFKDGEIVDQTVGLLSKDALAEKINSLI